MDSLAGYLQIACIARHHDKGQISAACSCRTFQQAAYLSIVEFSVGMGEVVGDLNKLRDMIAVNETEINFIVFVLTKIEKLLGGVFHTTK